MIDYAMVTKTGGREVNEDYVTMASYNDEKCFILCDGLGGHDCGEVASKLVADYIADKFKKQGDYLDFLDEAINEAQDKILEAQKENEMWAGMKTTLVVLVVTNEQVKWAHIGDSRLYHIFGSGEKYERTKDHSMVQILADMGEISEEEMRKHEDRNKLLRAMGASWGSKTYDKSAILEREGRMEFVLMTDGFWEYILEDEMLEILKTTDSAKAWLDKMTEIVEKNIDIKSCDNYSSICVKVE